jgi:hypothetical protein
VMGPQVASSYNYHALFLTVIMKHRDDAEFEFICFHIS